MEHQKKGIPGHGSPFFAPIMLVLDGVKVLARNRKTPPVSLQTLNLRYKPNMSFTHRSCTFREGSLLTNKRNQLTLDIRYPILYFFHGKTDARELRRSDPFLSLENVHQFITVTL